MRQLSRSLRKPVACAPLVWSALARHARPAALARPRHPSRRSCGSAVAALPHPDPSCVARAARLPQTLRLAARSPHAAAPIPAAGPPHAALPPPAAHKARHAPPMPASRGPLDMHMHTHTLLDSKGTRMGTR